MKLVKLTNKFAIFKKGDQIITRPLDAQAAKVLDWSARNITSNDK